MPVDIGLDTLDELLAGGAQLVEVLPAAEYLEEHLPGAVNIPLRGVSVVVGKAYWLASGRSTVRSSEIARVGSSVSPAATALIDDSVDLAGDIMRRGLRPAMSEFAQHTIAAMLGGAASAPRAAVDAVQYHGLTSLLNAEGSVSGPGGHYNDEPSARG